MNPGRPDAGGPLPAGPDDAELVTRVLAGERERYSDLVRRHQDALYRHACGMGLDHDTALDLVQDSFVKAFTSLDHCRDREKFRVWVFRILRNRCLDHLKSIRRNQVPLDRAGLRDEATPVREAERGEVRELLAQALAALPPDMRDAFLMKHHEGRSYEEMAEIASASVSAMKMRVHRAREALRLHLEDAGATDLAG